jgi:hypothetical protein
MQHIRPCLLHMLDSNLQLSCKFFIHWLLLRSLLVHWQGVGDTSQKSCLQRIAALTWHRRTSTHNTHLYIALLDACPTGSMSCSCAAAFFPLHGQLLPPGSTLYRSDCTYLQPCLLPWIVMLCFAAQHTPEVVSASPLCARLLRGLLGVF